MRRGRLKRATPLARGAAPQRRTPLTRTAPLKPGPVRAPGRREDGGGEAARLPLSASAAQRAKIVGSACVVCEQTKGITPAHLAPRSMGGCDEPACVVPLCWMHHRLYDTGGLELLPYLEPTWRDEVAHAVLHLGLIGAVRRMAPGRR
jgi:hypothetical protein